ncbi:MAG: glutamate--tRNA ligase [Chlamydiae bacterium]|nr:glutamate--tRNA ligase [Chlamydiota bacterium]
MENVRVRIAPSPTGDPHIGTAYMALFNIIFARRHNGTFILRIEDTDQKRSLPEYEENIFKALNWLGLHWEEGPDVGGPYGPYRQSERYDIYKEHAMLLLKRGKAYKCFATAEELEEMREVSKAMGKVSGYDRRYRNLSEEEIKAFEAEGRPYVIRLKVPLTGNCEFEDKVKGKIVTPWADVDDQVLLKSDGFPTYHLANVVDDHLMKITHVIRGDEWISSTPKHLYLYEAFGWQPPEFLHMPLLLGLDGKKLSKRRNHTSIEYYRASGYLPEAICNFLTLMGYSMPNEKEFYSREEIAKDFDVNRIGKSGAIFDEKKLSWLNQQYIINAIEPKDLWKRIKDWGFQDELMEKLAFLCQTRMRTFGDFMELCSFFFVNDLPLSTELLCQKGLLPEQAAAALQCLIWSLDEKVDWSSASFEASAKEICELFGLNFKKQMIPLLFGTIMGKLQGPPLFDCFEILGKPRARARILRAMECLGGVSNKKYQKLEKAWHARDLKSFFDQNASS